MKSLEKIYENYTTPDGNGDKGTAHTYIQEYENLLKPYRENGDILEIGISWGLSLKMWREYFINGIVAGVDIDIHPNVSDLINNENYKIFHSDATKPEFLEKLNGLKFDVIIDDGSHAFEHQKSSFNILKNSIKPGGIYIIEDILNIEHYRNEFISMHTNCKIIDNRHIKGRHDDVLAIYYL
jgi:cephalosporin hydroxylase